MPYLRLRLGWLTSALASATTVAISLAPVVLAVGDTICNSPGQYQAGELGQSGGFIIGTRATIEGQNNILCDDIAPPVDKAGSFQWVALQNATPAWDIGVNIVQLGYGRCRGTNNGVINSGGVLIDIGINCNDNNYYYWAWGSYCGGSIGGTVPGSGPIPLRIGPAQAATMPTKDYYVLRETVNGVSYYDGYVGGVLLQGTDALGNNRVARVPASSVCWNNVATDRYLAWFGETFNKGDSMGGWTGATRNHLDYNPLRYSYGTGWKATNGIVGPCNAGTGPPYSCTIAAADHTYIDSH